MGSFKVESAIIAMVLWSFIGCTTTLSENRYPPTGALNPAVTQATAAMTICVHGWTATIRPHVEYTDGLKTRQIAERGYRDTNPAHYEEDHFIPLELGGHPTDPNNLWPQPWPEARRKDRVENALHQSVCQGRLTLREAQEQMRKWSLE